ncbi:Protein KRI1 homolog [Anthophora retusa]
MSTLFNDDNSDSDGQLKINKSYAKNYDNWRQKEILNKLKAKYGDGTEGSESETSSEEEEENELTQQFDKDFYKTLAYLKNKDPKIYNEEVTFFEDTNKAQELHNEKKKQKTAKEKSMFLRDYERNIILERDGKFSDSEDENELKKKEIAEKVTYVQEQNQLKESFKDALQDEEEEDDLLKPKTKSQTEKEKEEADYKEWLKGQKAAINENEQQVLKPLRDFWSNPNLDANEKFLRDYILNNKYLDNNYTGSDLDDDASLMVHDSDEDLSKDEETIEKQEEFEHKYNFRFEEPDQEYLKRYPRTMDNSLRRKDTRRSEKRAKLRQRKEDEKLKKEEELKQLKALKRKEIEEKIEKVREITGTDDIKFNDIDLEGDFDPNEYDRKMTEIFNEDYYAAPEEDAKPEFPDIDEELEIEDTWDNYDPTSENYANGKEHEGPHCEDADFNMDADYDPSKKMLEDVNTSKRKRRRKSKFAELIAKKKPKFDPEQYKSYEEYFDKYYSLDYEDIIGDIPCRFKYRKVVPNDFGLTVEEILTADDRELNKWCSLKKALQYKSEHAELNDVKMFKRRAQNEALKKKIFRSLYTDPEEEEEGKEESTNTVSNTENTETKKKSKRKRKNSLENQNDSSTADHETLTDGKKENERCKKVKDTVEATTQEELKDSSKAEEKTPEEQSEQIKKKKKKKKKSQLSNLEKSAESVTENGLQKENETTDKIISEFSSKRKINNQSHDESDFKVSKKAKLKEEMKKKKYGKKGKDFKSKDINDDIASLNPERLKMYGINAKKLKNKLKYGKKQQ